MGEHSLPARFKMFSTCPPSNLADRSTYLRNVIDVARWSEDAGCEGILVYTDNGLVDPWLVAETIIQETERQGWKVGRWCYHQFSAVCTP